MSVPLLSYKIFKGRVHIPFCWMFYQLYQPHFLAWGCYSKIIDLNELQVKEHNFHWIQKLLLVVLSSSLEILLFLCDLFGHYGSQKLIVFITSNPKWNTNKGHNNLNYISSVAFQQLYPEDHWEECRKQPRIPFPPSSPPSNSSDPPLFTYHFNPHLYFHRFVEYCYNI